MPLYSVEAMNASLDGDYGTTRGPHAADAHEYALYDADPADGGEEVTEADCPGYERLTVNPADWEAAVDGEKSTVLLQMADVTGAWDIAPQWFILFDAADGTTAWDGGALEAPLNVTGAGAGPQVVATVYYDDSDDEPTP